jgi:hypothetical protein
MSNPEFESPEPPSPGSPLPLHIPLPRFLEELEAIELPPPADDTGPPPAIDQSILDIIFDDVHIEPRIRSSRRLAENINLLLSMGFSPQLIRRSMCSVDDIMEAALLVEQCLFFDTMGKVPADILGNVPLDQATFVGSRVVSQRHHMTYTVYEFDRENAAVFVLPILYSTFMWGRGSSRGYWVSMNSPDINFDFVRHRKPLPVWNESNHSWYSLPTFQLSTDEIESYRGQSWEDIRNDIAYQTSAFSIYRDLSDMSSPLSDYATKAFPVYPKYTHVESFRRFQESVFQHMLCVCQIHNIKPELVDEAVESGNRTLMEEAGHGLAVLYDEYHNYRDVYMAKHEKFRSQCLPVAKVNVDFDWTRGVATVTVSLNDMSKCTFRNNPNLKAQFADVISRAMAPKFYKVLHNVNTGGQSGRLFAGERASKVTSSFTAKETKILIPDEVYNKLQFQQKRILQFLVNRATQERRFGWSYTPFDNKRLYFNTTGTYCIVDRNEDPGSFLSASTPCGGIAIQPPKSGKSLVGALFAMQMSLHMHKKYGRTHKSLIIVNKCPSGFVENVSGYFSDKFTVRKWSKSINHPQELTYRNVTRMKKAGYIMVASIRQLKTDSRIKTINWDSLVLDDAHAYATVARVGHIIHNINLLRKPVCILTQNKMWKTREFNFYMHMLNMPGFHIENLYYARYLCDGMHRRYTLPVNIRKSMIHKYCIKDNCTLQKGNKAVYDVSTALVPQQNKDMAKILYENYMNRKRTMGMSFTLHAAATNMKLVPMKEFSSIRPEMLCGVRIYKQRMQDAIQTIDGKTESSKGAKRKLCEIMEGKENDDNKCSICMDKIEKPMLLNCEHIFCAECIRMNTKHSRKCPLCRKRLFAMKEIDEESPETAVIDGEVVEKDLLERWNHLCNTTSNPKVDVIKKMAKEHGCIAFYSRFKKLCKGIFELLRDDEEVEVVEYRTYKAALSGGARVKRALEAKRAIVCIVYPSICNSPVALSYCKILVANEPFLTAGEKCQLVSRFYGVNEEPPKIVMLKTKDSIDTIGSIYRDNTETGLVCDFLEAVAEEGDEKGQSKMQQGINEAPIIIS